MSSERCDCTISMLGAGHSQGCSIFKEPPVPMPDDRPVSPDPRVDVLATWLYEFYCEAGGTTMAAPATSLETWRRAQFRGSARRALTVIDAALSTPAGPSVGFAARSTRRPPMPDHPSWPAELVEKGETK